MTVKGISTTRLSLLGFIALLLIAWVCYRPALSGDFLLDDRSNLSGLATVEDTASAMDFILSGEAGPTGRPLALSTFAMQADNWDAGAESFLLFNVLLHLGNAALLAACLYLLSRLQGVGEDRSAVVAVLAAGCWVLMPLLATSSLHVVQRMTTLSATFVLVGLFGYLWGRRGIADAPRRSLWLMSASVVLGTGISLLAKETGLLFPVYVLVLEATVLARPAPVQTRQWRIWQGVFLVLPAVVIAAYLSMRAVYPEWTVARHGFTAWERVLSELPLLWLYLKKALIGIPSALGVYQMPAEIRRSLFEPVVFVSAVAWVAAIAAAFHLRRQIPLFSLAVFWYLAGHTLESTVLSLELYFEHRNYLPIVGPVYAAIAALVLGSAQVRRAAFALVPLYLASSAFLLYLFASLSGDPSASSRYWAHRYPDSVRAVATMATYQLQEEGPIQAMSTLDLFVAQHPQHGYLRIQELNLRCRVMPAEDHGVVLDELQSTLPDAVFTFTAGRMLSQLATTVGSTDCNGVDLNTVTRIAESLRSGSRYAYHPGYNQFHHKLLAGIARQTGDLDRTLAELERAIAFGASSELNMMMVTTLAAQGEFGNARQFIDDALGAGPFNPLRAIGWRRDLRKLRVYIDELERYSVGEG